MKSFYFLTKYVQSRLLQNCRMRERVQSFLLPFFKFMCIQYIQGDASGHFPVVCLSVHLSSMLSLPDVNPFLHTTNLQQTTLEASWHKWEFNYIQLRTSWNWQSERNMIGLWAWLERSWNALWAGRNFALWTKQS